MDGHPIQGLTGSERAYGSRPEPLRPAYRLTRAAAGGEHLTLYVEMACNRLFGIEGAPRFVLQQAEIAAFDRDAWDLLWDFKVIADMAPELPENTPRAGQALQAGNNMVNAVRLDDRATWAVGRAHCRRLLLRPQRGWTAQCHCRGLRPPRHRLALAAGRDAP